MVLRLFITKFRTPNNDSYINILVAGIAYILVSSAETLTVYAKCTLFSMARCKTAVTPLLPHWSYCSPVLNHLILLVLLLNNSILVKGSWYAMRFVWSNKLSVMIYLYTWIRFITRFGVRTTLHPLCCCYSWSEWHHFIPLIMSHAKS